MTSSVTKYPTYIQGGILNRLPHTHPPKSLASITSNEEGSKCLISCALVSHGVGVGPPWNYATIAPSPLVSSSQRTPAGKKGRAGCGHHELMRSIQREPRNSGDLDTKEHHVEASLKEQDHGCSCSPSSRLKCKTRELLSEPSIVVWKGRFIHTNQTKTKHNTTL